MKKCKYCQSEIDERAKVCPNCHRDLRNYFLKHKVFTVIIGLILLGMITSNMILKSNPNTSETSFTDNNSVNKNTELITLSEFNQIETGMTYEQVKEIVGSEGTLTSDVSIGDERYHTKIYTWYGNTLTGANANVTFQGGKVIGKAQVGLK